MDATEFDITLAQLRADMNRLDRLGRVKYSPWHLGASVSGALVVWGAAVLSAYALAAAWWAAVAAGVMAGALAAAVALPIPAAVIVWAWGAWRVEWGRLRAEPEQYKPAPPAAVGYPAPSSDTVAWLTEGGAQ